MFHLFRFTCKLLGGMAAAAGIIVKVARQKHHADRTLHHHTHW